MKKTNTYLYLILMLVFVINANAQQVKKDNTAKPNFLFICIDDLRPQLGVYGNNLMITPNLDKLASEGRTFTRHYAQVPTCGPSRACMLTGKNIEAIEDINHHHLEKSLAGKPESLTPETFVHHLKRNGYFTVGMGKISHSGNGHVNFKNKSVLELPYSWDQFVTDPNSLWEGQELVHAYANGRNRNTKPNPAYEILDVEDESYPDGILANLATNQLEQLANKQKPFFMAVGFYKPHLPFCAPKKYWDMYDHKDIKVSPNPELPKGVSGVFLHNSTEFFGQYTHPEKGGAGKRLSDEYAKNVIHANYASISYTDAQVGKVLNKLKELNLDKNTIVIVWGDHGWHLGDHTIWGKHSTFERGLNSKLLLKTPDIKESGVKTDGLVSSIDLYPTICDLAGIELPKSIDGKSMVPLINNPKTKGNEVVLSYWRNILSMRTDRYRFAVFNNGKRQEMMLFDHDKDPNETINIANENPEVVDRLIKQLKTKNKGFLPNF
ncbi:sulfatase [Lutibacter citreus]|uniref:sulfatase n=1 Tax=Lutibacter citreus TaxID=2138210 RepID=UPI000DBE7657|nr:sulfatase [Lutibacter citreus]